MLVTYYQTQKFEAWLYSYINHVEDSQRPGIGQKMDQKPFLDVQALWPFLDLH